MVIALMRGVVLINLIVIVLFLVLVKRERSEAFLKQLLDLLELKAFGFWYEGIDANEANQGEASKEEESA